MVNRVHRRRAVVRLMTRPPHPPGLPQPHALMVQVPHLASHVLSQCANRIAQDWMIRYGVEPVILETFVDPERGFWGTCYKAANWIYLGQTTGRGKDDHTNKVNRSLKLVFGYPLRKDFRQVLCD